MVVDLVLDNSKEVSSDAGGVEAVREGAQHMPRAVSPTVHEAEDWP